MKAVLKIASLLIKCFFHSKRLVALYAFGVLIGLLQIGFELLPASQRAAGSAFHLLLALTLPFVGLVLWIVLAIVSYEFSKQVFGRGRDDLFRVRSQGHIRVVGAVLFASVAMCIVTVFIFVLIIAILAYSVGLSGDAYTNAVSVALLWLGGPALTASLLGVLLGRVTSRSVGYGVMATLFVCITPLASNLIADRFVHMGTSDSLSLILYWTLIAPFDLTAPFVTVIPDSIFLLPSGLHQWLLPAIWTLAILIGLGFSLWKSQKLSLFAAVLSIFILGTPWAIYGNRIAVPTFSDTLTSDIQDSSLMSDIFDGSISGSLHLHQSAFIPDVAKYSISIEVRDMLHGSVTVQLSEPFLDIPKFTLFRSYHVSEISNEHGESLDFLQEGDLVTILTPGQEEGTEFRFEYAGSGWGNYANRQGIFLSGTFPWYPWPGKQRFYWECDMHSVGVSRHIARRGAVEIIEVRTRSTFEEILTPQGITLLSSDVHTSISAESLTLMAGQVRRLGDVETLFFFGGDASLEWYDGLEYRFNINDQRGRQQILDEAHVFRSRMGLADVEMRTFTFVLVPTFPAYSGLFSIPVNQCSYILVDAGSVIDYAVALAFQDIPQVYEKRELYEVLYRFLSDPEDHFFLNPGSGIPTIDGFPPGKIGNLFTDLLLVHDEDYVVRRVVEYLTNEDITMRSEDYLTQLLKDESKR
ncbi:MAG: hypothetical protein FWD93_05400 [Coriobacteriia bacterium]|nr:hypothetical protein [Coriobacteriia bacterium]